MSTRLSWRRFLAVLGKEFIQMRRDRLTFAMMIGVPLMQLILFGYAINTDPKQLPAALLVGDQSVFARSLVRALENSEYFEFVQMAGSEAEANAMLMRGDVQFVISIPERVPASEPGSPSDSVCNATTPASPPRSAVIASATAAGSVVPAKITLVPASCIASITPARWADEGWRRVDPPGMTTATISKS